MAHDNHRCTSIAHDSTDLTIENTTYGSSWLSLDVDTFLIQRHMPLDIRHGVCSEMIHDPVVADNRHGQPSTVTLEGATQLTIYR